MSATRMGETVVYHGDCLDVMATLAAVGTQVDSIVTDPPYHLTGKPGGAQGFMGKEWDGGDIAFRPETWRRCWDLLKPGGYLLAFSSARTYHRMACAIEDAGFDIRDQLMWLYGTGFPKSHDVSKAIDKAAGVERDVVGKTMAPRKAMDRHPDTAKYGFKVGEIDVTAPATDAAREWDGWGTALKPAHEPVVMARKPLDGTVAANVLKHGVGAINIDASRVGTDSIRTNAKNKGSSFTSVGDSQGFNGCPEITDIGKGRFPANVLHDGSPEVLEAFAAYGETKSSRGVKGGTSPNPMSWGDQRADASMVSGFADQGTAARFFYTAKASKKDRAGSKHPTVKPVDLIRYFATMVTPPGGVCLDPFAGSGTLGAAWPRSILIERDAEYHANIIGRLIDAL